MHRPSPISFYSELSTPQKRWNWSIVTVWPVFACCGFCSSVIEWFLPSYVNTDELSVIPIELWSRSNGNYMTERRTARKFAKMHTALLNKNYHLSELHLQLSLNSSAPMWNELEFEAVFDFCRLYKCSFQCVIFSYSLGCFQRRNLTAHTAKAKIPSNISWALTVKLFTT